MVKIICITITQVALKRKKNKEEYLFRTKILSKQVSNLMVELKHQRTADKKWLYGKGLLLKRTELDTYQVG